MEVKESEGEKVHKEENKSVHLREKGKGTGAFKDYDEEQPQRQKKIKWTHCYRIRRKKFQKGRQDHMT